MSFISIVTGTYNEVENIDEFVERVHLAMEELKAYAYEIIIIDNASVDGTQERLRLLAADDPRVKAIFNARNFGHVRSPYHGLLQAGGDAAILLASDLQDPPELIPEFVRKWEQGAKAVVGVRTSTEESAVFEFLRASYYDLVARLSEVKIIQKYTGFGLYDRQILSICRDLEDPYPYFRGQISEIGLPTEEIAYHKPTRKRGITKNNFYTLYDMAMLGITNHSKVPLRMAAMMGFFMSIVSLLTGLSYLAYKLLFWDRFSAGMAPVVIGLFLFCSVQLFFIGIIGEYIGAILTHVRKLPLVVEKERINFPAITPQLPELIERRRAA